MTLMWRRFLLLLLCVLIPLKAVMAAECDCPSFSEAVTLNMQGHHVVDTQSAHQFFEAHHHHSHAVSAHGDDQDASQHSDHHCVGTLGWLLPSSLTLAQWAGVPHAMPGWLDRPLPAPVLEQPPRPPHWGA